MRASAVLHQVDGGVKPAARAEVVGREGPHIPAEIGVNGTVIEHGGVRIAYDLVDVDAHAVVEVLGEGEGAVVVVELELEGPVEVVTGQADPVVGAEGFAVDIELGEIRRAVVGLAVGGIGVFGTGNIA